MKKKKLNFDTYKAEVNEYLKKKYGSTLADLMIGDEDVENAIANEETPVEYVDWMAKKYGFTKLSDWTAGKAAEFMSRFKS